MKTKPRSLTVDQVASLPSAIEQPFALILEIGPAFSVLIGRRIEADRKPAQVVVEDSTQLRLTEHGEAIIRRYPAIRIRRDESLALWVASPDHFETPFSQPSADPYVLLTLPQEEASLLEKFLCRQSIDDAFELLRREIAKLPAFYSPSEDELRAPEQYASAKGRFAIDQCFL